MQELTFNVGRSAHSQWEYVEVRQAGNHILLRTETPGRQTLPIPHHKPLRTGTLAAILKMVSEHKQIPREEILAELR